MDHETLRDTLLTHIQSRAGEADVAHDIGHLSRVLSLSLLIGNTENEGNLLVLTAASLLHDYIALPKSHPERHLASRLSSQQAVRILTPLGFPDELMDDTINAIEAHSQSANLPIKCIEAAIVQDADRLDALGAIGIARCFAVCGHIGRPLFHPDDPLAHNRELNTKLYGVDYFLRKLIPLPETMNTKTAYQIGKERVSYLQDFLTRLENEVFIETAPTPQFSLK